MKKTYLPVGLLIASTCFAQNYTIDWHKITGGGVSAGGIFQVAGAIGQPDAGGAMSGGDFSLTGGFWSIAAVVQTAGAPKLIIIPNGPTSVIILWPDTGGYTLQQNSNLNTTNWTPTGHSITTANGTNSVAITPPAGNWFFRLSR